MDLTISIISWNTEKLLRECLRSIYKYTTGIEFEVVVVDNNSNDSSCHMVDKEFPQVNLLRNTKNEGFSRGHNKAINNSTGRYIAILNSDTYIMENTFAELLKFMDDTPNAALCTPKLLNPDGSIQPMMLEETLPFKSFLKIINLYNADKYYSYIDLTKPMLAGTVGGPCLLVRRYSFNQIGQFDERYFLYNEEEDICRRLREKNWEIYHYPLVNIVHHHGKSISQDPIVERVKFEYRRSNLLFFKKFYPWHIVVGFKILFQIISLLTIFKFAFKILFNSRERDSIKKLIKNEIELLKLCYR